MAELAANGSRVYGDAAPYFGWWAPSGEVTAACLRTPPYPMLVTGLDRDAASALAATRPQARPDESLLTGMTGPPAEASAFADAWLGPSGRGPRSGCGPGSTGWAAGDARSLAGRAARRAGRPTPDS